jgi:hypothetical protein
MNVRFLRDEGGKAYLAIDAKTAWAQGLPAFLEHIRRVQKPTAADREFVANLIDYLHWHAFDHGHANPRPKPKMPTQYRAPGRRGSPSRAIYEHARVVQWLANARGEPPPTPSELRKLVAESLGTSWNALRQRIYKAQEPHRTRLRRLFQLPEY